MIHRLLPASVNVFRAACRRDAGRKRPRAADRLLGVLGSSWRASPLRRLVQLAALGVFLWLFFHVSFPPGHVFDPQSLSAKETLPVEVFLWLDPLVGVSAGVAASATASPMTVLSG